jgi:hypothetical protein
VIDNPLQERLKLDFWLILKVVLRGACGIPLSPPALILKTLLALLHCLLHNVRMSGSDLY